MTDEKMTNEDPKLTDVQADEVLAPATPGAEALTSDTPEDTEG